MATMIPAFLSIDAEPNERSPVIGHHPWTGFESLVDFFDGLRAPLAERSGVEPHPTWFFRMDPVIERCFGRADFGVQVDLTVEPGMEPVHDDSTFGTRTTGPSTDFRGYPRYPYRVSRRSFAEPATSDDDARRLVEIPRTTYDFERAFSRFRRRLKMRVLGLGSPMPVNVYDVWPSPKTFW